MMTQVYAHESRPGNRVGLHYSRFQRKPAVHFNINQLLGPTKKSQNPLFHRRIREDGLEHFQANRTPVRVKKMRRNKDLEPRSDSIGTERALALAGEGLPHLLCPRSLFGGGLEPSPLRQKGAQGCWLERFA